MNTNTDFDKIDKVLSKNGGGLFSTCWCVGQAIRRARLGLEEERRTCWLLGEMRLVMGHSHIADEVIKDGIKKMIAEYLDKYYVKNY